MVCCAVTVSEEVVVASTSRVASAARIVGVAALACFAGSPTLIQLGILGPGIGFRTFLLGAFLGLLAVVLGGVGLWLTRAAAAGGRDRAATGTVLGAAIVAVVLVAGAGGGGVPPINDITTDLDDPPVFVAALALDDNDGRDMGYPEGFALQQRAGYPELAPIRLETTPGESFEKVEAAVAELSWETTGSDRAAGRLEATKTSSIFRFVDDIVIRIRPDGSASVVDVRAKSRIGRSDLGANAGHIAALRDILTR